MQRIVTLTMNPAVDKSAEVDHVGPDKKLRCERPRFEPGGGGVNVSRAAARLGGESLCLFTAGGVQGELLQQLIAQEPFELRRLEVSGRTRVNLTVYETSSGSQYRFGMPGPELSEDEWRGILKTLEELDPAPEFLVASGSLPPGVPDDFYARVADIGAEREAKVVVDTSGTPLAEATEAGLYLLKPNLRELADLTGMDLEDEADQEQAAQRLVSQGKVQAVVLSLGAAGALLVTEDGRRRLRAPTVSIRSKVGAGDSMVAGMVLALARGEGFENAVRFGVAAGAAAVKTPGSELCRREDAEALFERIEAEG